jgi:hypothetical protein
MGLLVETFASVWFKSDLRSYRGVPINFQNCGIKAVQKDNSYLLIGSLSIVPASFLTIFTSLIQGTECPRKRYFSYRLSSLATVCCMNETLSNLVPFISVVNLGNKGNQPALNDGRAMEGMA